ncbi:MAG TPA: chromosome segregation SMC family protein [Nitrosopumilaceae archaeon]|nr:chromosome segregation SMC family protein [Nitrosopumilaceae archaeon]
MVHITKVEMFGFKSFGFKNTTVDFQPGLVSISGPNGSGKSNILDAIIFALGENRPKTMRVDKLRSLIHDIEGERRGPKMARVSVHFDNSDRKIPIDSDSVTFTREMDDKGENIYYIDKKHTQRNQILDLLDMANAGLHQLNAVQQGTVTRISEFTSEEKRQSIEDLIGLSYFDEKKKESEAQLEQADRRLEVAMAKMGEIKKRIDELEEERNQLLRNDLLTREVNRFNAIESANKLKLLRSSQLSKERTFHALTSEIKKFEEERAIIRKEAHEIESQKKKFMDEVNAYNQSKATIDSELTEAIQKSEQEKSEINTSKKRLAHIETRLPEIKLELETLQSERESLDSTISQMRLSIQQINDTRKNINEEVKAIDYELSKVRREQSDISLKKQEVDKKIKSLNNKFNSAKLSLSKFESEKNDIENKINLNTIKNSESELQLNNLERLKQKLESVIANHKATVDELKIRISKLELQREKILKDIDDVSLILEKASKSTAQYETKIKVVKGVMHEDYSISQLKNDSDTLGILGLVYELLSWNQEYERAALAVSSDMIKAIVVKDFTTLLNLADFVRSKKLPKLKIIPLDAIPNLTISPPSDSKIIGMLSDFIKCDEKYSSLKTLLFGNVVLVNSREDALRISKTGYKAVTLEGEFFEARAGSVIVDFNSKISKLTKIITMSTSIDGLNNSIELLRKFIQSKKFKLKRIETSLKNYNDRLSISDTGLATTSNNYSDLKSKIISTSKLVGQLSSRNSQLARRLEHLQTEIAKQDSYVLSLEERIKIVSENFSDPRQTKIAQELSRLNEKKSVITTQQSNIVSELKEKESEIAKLIAQETAEKLKSKNIHEEHASLNEEKQQLEVKLRTLEKEFSTTNDNLIKLREREQELISTSGKSVSQVNEFDSKLSELHNKEHTLTKEISNRERQSDALSRDLKEIEEKATQIQKLISHYGYTESIETFDVEQILKALSSEQHKLSESINRRAAEQYIDLATGYRSMSTRKNELEEERNSIVKFIESIEKDKRQTFLDAFDIVDKEIRAIFSKMTGGNAWLELENEDDIFSSGISYMIQFKDKPKRTSTSISGGEKTLAAVVFVLALQKLKPSPFYLFDEVDAHLDAPNSEKLAKIIEERSKGSQFLMVSLKDSVVEKAKLIYGVYPKNGVSHIVTYKDKRLPSMTT